MSDQPDGSLPEPTPDETARLMREGAHGKVPAWKRLLPPWAFSVGLHLFVLPFVLVVTVTFADSLFVPSVWNDVRDEKLGDDPHSNLLVEGEDAIAKVQEKVVPLADLGDRKLKEMPHGAIEPQSTPASTSDTETRGTLAGSLTVNEVLVRVTVKSADGQQLAFECNGNTQVVREGDSRIDPFRPGPVPPDTPLRILGTSKDGNHIARAIFVGNSTLPKQPQANNNGNFAIEQPAVSKPVVDRVETKAAPPADFEIRSQFSGMTIVDIARPPWWRIHVTVKTADGKGITFECDENTKLSREDDPRFLPLAISTIPPGTPLRIQGYAKDGKYVAVAIFAKLPARKN